MIMYNTVDSIMASFTKTLTQLQKCAEAHSQKAAGLEIKIEELEDAQSKALDEMHRASKIATKLEALISDD